jgi:hypothetical protein
MVMSDCVGVCSEAGMVKLVEQTRPEAGSLVEGILFGQMLRI